MRYSSPALYCLASIVFFGAPASLPAAAETTGQYAVIDLMPEFWSFYSEVKHLPVEAQARRFRETVATRHPVVYNREVLGISPDEPLDTAVESRYRMAQHLVGANIDVMRSLSDSIGRSLTNYEAEFRKTFPDLAYKGEIYFMHSVGAFDGGTRKVKGRTALLFGLDMITYVRGRNANPRPFFHHELFHLYHDQFKGNDEVGGTRTVLAALWREGLAVYVAHKLNPGAHGVDLFGLPRSTPGRVQANLRQLCLGLAAVLDSSSDDDYARYFLGAAEGAPVPSRSGYVIGYLVAKELARTRTLQQLARTPVGELREDIRQALLRVADAGADDPELLEAARRAAAAH